MDKAILNKAILNFSVEEELNARASLYESRDQFVKRFSKRAIRKMSIDDYVEGKGSRESFCYGLEWALRDLGRINGSSSIKFGVYYSSEIGSYIHAEKYGKSREAAFETIKEEILSLLQAGVNGDIEALVRNRISPMFKGKILATYFPNRYLNVFSNKDLLHFLKLLDIRGFDDADEVRKREALVGFKNSDPVMQAWSLDIFGWFLYKNFSPRQVTSEEEAIVLDPGASYDLSRAEIDGSFDYEHYCPSLEHKGIAPKPDYEAEARKAADVGKMGEEIVLQAEIDRVKLEQNYSEEQANKVVIPMSEDSDSHGYDIKSLNSDGSIRYIEVKTTTRKIGEIRLAEFFLTRWELMKAEEYGQNYYIYYVSDVLSHPQIHIILNPFLDKEKIKMIPDRYKVFIAIK